MIRWVLASGLDLRMGFADTKDQHLYCVAQLLTIGETIAITRRDAMPKSPGIDVF